ncbi:beta-glucuronidase [Pillotina sp. SPG140]|jgi:beta-glucuronidase
MKPLSENYQADIHNADYEQEYLSTMLTAQTLINTAGRTAESLNGMWNFGADWYDTCRRAHWFKEETADSTGNPLPSDWDFEAWERLPVPACWNLEKPLLHYFEGMGVYTRTFNYIPKHAGERVFLRFEGVAYRASLFLNKQFIGTHDGASTPFNVEISNLLKTENRLLVVVDARRLHERIPMENTDWFQYGGLYRDVALYRVPQTFIKDWFVRLVPGSNFSTITATVTLSDLTAKGKLCINIDGLIDGAEIAMHEGTGEITCAAAPHLWSPEDPFLYTVQITYQDGGLSDTVCDTIGFREIRTHGSDILLNGRKILLNGISVHEDHHTLGKTTNEEIIRQTIRHIKELSGNYLRLAHYPHDSRFARIADKEGILLWEEIPVYWSVDFSNPGTYGDAENQLAELVLRDRNRASVIVWSVGNENADTDERFSFMSRLASKAREYDSTRLISAACLINHAKLKIEDRLQETLDVIGINEYYGWYDPEFEKLPLILSHSNPTKPVVICEFGGGARYGQHGTEDDLFTEEKQRSLYEKQIETIARCPYIAGITPWILYDFRCPRRLNRYQAYFNRKGLIDADRVSKKLAFTVLQRFYATRKSL